MPDLGKYATEVFAAYGASLLLIAALVTLSWTRARRMRRALRDLEERRKRNGKN
ncbi:MAG: heme exporter protein CcmD [Halocynthiibacter sp.]